MKEGYMSGTGTFKVTDNEGRIWEVIEQDGYEWLVRKLDTTHFSMAMKQDFDKNPSNFGMKSYHVAQFNNNPEFYQALIKWLGGAEMIGGKSFKEDDLEDDSNTISEEKSEEKDTLEEKADIDKMIKDLAGSFGGSNEEQGKMVQIMKGLAFSDDPKANKFMKAMDKATTAASKEVLGESVENEPEEITEEDVEEASKTATVKCPDCGNKVLKNTMYCVSCKKKIKPKKESSMSFELDTFIDELDRDSSVVKIDTVEGESSIFVTMKNGTEYIIGAPNNPTSNSIFSASIADGNGEETDIADAKDFLDKAKKRMIESEEPVKEASRTDFDKIIKRVIDQDPNQYQASVEMIAQALIGPLGSASNKADDPKKLKKDLKKFVQLLIKQLRYEISYNLESKESDILKSIIAEEEFIIPGTDIIIKKDETIQILNSLKEDRADESVSQELLDLIFTKLHDDEVMGATIGSVIAAIQEDITEIQGDSPDSRVFLNAIKDFLKEYGVLSGELKYEYKHK